MRQVNFGKVEAILIWKPLTEVTVEAIGIGQLSGARIQKETFHNCISGWENEEDPARMPEQQDGQSLNKVSFDSKKQKSTEASGNQGHLLLRGFYVTQGSQSTDRYHKGWGL